MRMTDHLQTVSLWNPRVPMDHRSCTSSSLYTSFVLTKAPSEGGGWCDVTCPLLHHLNPLLRKGLGKIKPKETSALEKCSCGRVHTVESSTGVNPRKLTGKTLRRRVVNMQPVSRIIIAITNPVRGF